MSKPRLALSSIALRHLDPRSIADELPASVVGLEVAPTAVWPDVEAVDHRTVRRLRRELTDVGLQVSGVQSLLFGRPDLQLLEPRCWPELRHRLSHMVTIAADLGAQRAVFGSPRNRVRGSLGEDRATELAATFFRSMVSVLEENDVTLTLEPNAPAYGADFLITYDEVCELAGAIASTSIRPQIDTGCLVQVDDDPVAAVRRELPAHVHVSAPGLAAPDDDIVPLAPLKRALRETGYDGWIVLEMLPKRGDPDEAVRSAELSRVLRWFADGFSDLRESM